jgi:hypothetical protein
MGYRLVADLAMVAHFGFLGGFVALWRRWVLWPHVVAVGLGVLDRADVLAVPADERGELGSRTFRGARLSGTGFIDHYIEGVIYPEEHAPPAPGAGPARRDRVLGRRRPPAGTGPAGSGHA